MGIYFNLMKQHLELKNYSPYTVTTYLTHMKNFIKFHMKDPSLFNKVEARLYFFKVLINLQDITAYQVFLVYSKKVAYNTFNLAVCSIKYFYKHIFKT